MKPFYWSDISLTHDFVTKLDLITDFDPSSEFLEVVRLASSGRLLLWTPGSYGAYYYVQREKGRDLTQFYDKSAYTDRKIQKAMWQHKNATKNFDYTTIEDRLRTVSWGNDSYPTSVVKLVYGISTFPQTAKAV